ncbi:MAG: cupin [Proteobacteria bacterium]|nr:MAG: cupin [Pseudomonadota bacterium]
MTTNARALGILSIAASVLIVPQGGVARAEPPTVTPLLTKELAGVPGREVVMMTVEYGPGGADPVHRHHAQALVYVLEGSVEMQVEGGELVTLTPGQTFYESADDLHVVGRNASKTEPAKFLVVLVKDRGTPLLIPE